MRTVFKQVKGDYNKKGDEQRVIGYAIGEHCTNGVYGAVGLAKGSAKEMAKSMVELKKEYGKDSGRGLCHFIISPDMEQNALLSDKDNGYPIGIGT